MKKRGLLAVLLIMVMTLLCGCKGMSAEDAQSYAKSIMDASYKGEFDKYIEWTKSSKEEAQKLYEGNIDATMQEAGFSGLGLSEELTASYRQLFLDMIKQAKYEVGEAKEAGDKAYTVDVTVEPFIAFEGLQSEVQAAVTEEVQNLAETPDQNTIQEMVFQKMYDLMAQKVAAPVYGDPATVTITVKPDSNGVYYIEQSDMTALDDALFPSDNF
ncbi:MAG: hypothetical protein K1W22_04555 [Lachnospiraceae bacterium]